MSLPKPATRHPILPSSPRRRGSIRATGNDRNKLYGTTTAIIFYLLLCVGISDNAAQSQPASDILPIWREIFARPSTRLEAIPAPASNPLTPEKIKLGQQLFTDPRLSGSGNRSCATCHDPNRAFTDGRRHAAALDGKTLLANTPALINLAWAKRLFWDGRAESLEEQARFPIEHPQEMAGSWPDISARLSADPNLIAGFRQAFPDNPAPTATNIAAALATYQRTLVAGPSRFDNFIAGDNSALTATERLGFTLFVGKAGCVSCHSGWRLTDDQLHRTGRTTNAIKTPTLRGLTSTGPYMHDGSLASISDVLVHYESLKADDPALSLSLVRPLILTIVENDALSAFLRSLD